MKKLLLLSVCILMGTFSSAQSIGELTIKVSDKKNRTDGRLVLLLFTEADGFPGEVDQAAYKGRIDQVVQDATYTFKDLPYGKYAVSVFLDKNKNGKVDKNFIGFPKEPVGASNMTRLGKPNFKKCLIEFTQAKKTIEIRYLN